MAALLNSRTIWQIPSILHPSHGFPGSPQDGAQGTPPWEVLGSTHAHVCCAPCYKEQGDLHGTGPKSSQIHTPPTHTMIPGRSKDPRAQVQPAASPQLWTQQRKSPAGRGKQHRDWLYHRLLPLCGLPASSSLSFPSDKGG